MTEVYLLNCSCFFDRELFLKGMSLLSHYRQKKVNQSKNRQAKVQRLGAGVLLSHALKQRNLSEREMEYRVDEKGKPYFANRSDLFFSLSHSGDFVLCALSDSQVGVDVQVISEYNARVSERCFLKEEAQRLASLSGEERNREFTRLWARKESVVKYFGTWNQSEGHPPVTTYSEIDEVQISVCTEDTPVFHSIKDISEILLNA